VVGPDAAYITGENINVDGGLRHIGSETMLNDRPDAWAAQDAARMRPKATDWSQGWEWDMTSQDNEYDFVVVGSGGGSCQRARHARGRQAVLIVEKQAKIGGTSAFRAVSSGSPTTTSSTTRGGGDSHERSRDISMG
jgi:hypothetical protein